MDNDPAQQIHEEFPSVSPRPPLQKIMSTPESQFLHQINPQLQVSGPVKLAVSAARHEGHRVPNEPGAKISAYLGRLAGHSLIAEIPKDKPVEASKLLERREKQIEARLVRTENIPESFWEAQRQAAREQGFGDIEADVRSRSELIEILRKDQRQSLRRWVEYLSDSESEYPTWFKYYVLNSMTKLTDYNKEKGTFPRRSKSTTDPFPGLNREALAYVYDKLGENLQGKKPDDAKLAQLVQGGNFAKLYAHSLAEVGFTDPELLKETRGSWVKYSQSQNPNDASRLVDSLKAYGTGWCIAGEGTAETYLGQGDMYVFYSRDKDGVDRVPRVAIRMENGVVREVRGIIGGGENVGPAENRDQEVEPELIDVTMGRLKSLPGAEEYQKKAADMQQLTIINHKIKANPHMPLSREETLFLYEIDHTIQGFGYEYQNGRKDPRITELREMRGELDYPLLKELIVESLEAQIEASQQGANQIIEQLNSMRRPSERLETINSDELKAALETKLVEWKANGSLEWCVRQMVENGGRINLLVTPNVLAEPAEIIKLATTFGEGQPHQTYVYNELYQLYSREELSGKPSGAGNFRLSLIPGAYDKKMYGTVDQQRISLQTQRAKTASLKVPSILDGLTLWQTLRSGGDQLKDSSAFDKTIIRHFDLEDKGLHGWLYVPYSSVSRDGKPYLYFSYTDRDRGARLAVG
ncbi:hypothetical protein BVY00_00855 [bacterium G20]|nr:hypothetical protein BVY00_00855 [bacterium G20]